MHFVFSEGGTSRFVRGGVGEVVSWQLFVGVL